MDSDKIPVIDHLGTRFLKDTLYKDIEGDIIFSSEVLKFNKYHKKQGRKLLMTETAIYNMKAK